MDKAKEKKLIPPKMEPIESSGPHFLFTIEQYTSTLSITTQIINAGPEYEPPKKVYVRVFRYAEDGTTVKSDYLFVPDPSWE